MQVFSDEHPSVLRYPCVATRTKVSHKFKWVCEKKCFCSEFGPT